MVRDGFQAFVELKQQQQQQQAVKNIELEFSVNNS